MKHKWVILVAAGALLSGLTASAHHSFTATYDEAKTIKIEGELVQFMFRNPHAFVHVMAPEPQTKEMVRWAWCLTRDRPISLNMPSRVFIRMPNYMNGSQMGFRVLPCQHGNPVFLTRIGGTW